MGKLKTCASCGMKFYSKHARWERSVCSEKCRRARIVASKRKGKYLKCEQCGKEFWAKPYDIKKGKKFCSVDCFYDWKKKSHKTLICQWCNKAMEVTRMAEHGKKYCSVGCHDKAQVKKVEVHCTICGSPTLRLPSIVKRQDVFLCSKECISEYFLERVVFFQSRTNTKPERMFNEQTPDYIDQTSDGKFYVNFNNGRIKNPDFIVRPVNETKKVIEIFGRYWHKDEEEGELIGRYKEVGYDCLVLWEEEVYNETYRNKLENFLSGSSAVLAGNS